MNAVGHAEEIDLALRQIDFRKYALLAKSMLAGVTAVVACDLKGRRVWSLARESRDVYAGPLNRLTAAVPDWPSTGVAIRRCTIDKGMSAYVTSISGEDKQPLAGLFVLVSHDQDGKDLNYKRLSDGLHQLARMLGDEILLLAELSSMTDELSQRYEELNLIYHTDDNVKYFDEGQDAIRKLVKNTCEYLNASFCAVVMSGKKIVMSHSNPDRNLRNVEQLEGLAQGDVYDHIAFRKEVLVHNGGARYRELLESVDCKLLGCPIFDENNEVIGVLFLATPPEAQDFSSSDRRLLQVMAHKASRIIEANYDSLTGMMTRNGFEYHLETGLYIVRYKQVMLSVLNINIDRLHVVNDTSGHHAGDELIRTVAWAIRDQLGPDDVISRIGGGEFGVLLSEKSAEDGEDVAERVLSAVRKCEFVRDGRRFALSVSIGMATMETSSESILSVLSAAEVACAAAKDLGRDRVQVYQMDNTMLVRRRAQIHWLGQLHSALREDNFQLYCQPIAPVNPDNKHHHAEILLRLEGDNGEILAPGVFLGAAERYNLMPAIDRWVIRNTLKTLVANLPKRMLAEHIWAINLSGQSFSDSNFMQFILDETARSGIDPGCLCFEITETAAVANLREAGQFMAELRSKGFRFSLDDFGSGLSSFAYLKALPVDYLKIDGSIAKEVVNDRISASMVGAICQIGRDMELETIAEFVENKEIEEKLGTLGVHYVQGYGVGKPRALIEQIIEMTSSLSDGEETVTAPAIDLKPAVASMAAVQIDA